MTIENQIPKLIIGLILVTFSFAIAGLMVDLMYVVIYLIFSVLSPINSTASAALSPVATNGLNIVQVGEKMDLFGTAHVLALSIKDPINNILGIHGQRSLDDLSTVGDLISNIVHIGDFTQFSVVDAIYDLISVFTGLRAASMASSVVGLAILQTIAGAAVGITVFQSMEFFLRNIVPYLLIFFVVLIAILFSLGRVFFMLLQAYIFLLFDVLFAPFWILAGLIPGSSQGRGFGLWIRDVIANLSVFPAVYAMFLIGKILIESMRNQPAPIALPLLGNPLATTLAPNATQTTSAIGALIGLGIILTTPEVMKLVKAFFKAPNISLAGVGTAIGMGAAVSSLPARLAGRELFGRDPKTGQPKTGSAWAGRTRLGRIAQFATGGGTQIQKDEAGNILNNGRLPSMPGIVKTAAKPVTKPFSVLKNRYQRNKENPPEGTVDFIKRKLSPKPTTPTAPPTTPPASGSGTPGTGGEETPEGDGET